MSASSQTGSTIIPCLRCRDVHAAIDWLCKAFGFTKNAVYENEQGGVEHAQLTWGNGMVMLGEVRNNEFGRHIAQPDEIGGRKTQSACVIVANCKSHYQQAENAGAVIVDDYAEKEHGGAGYRKVTCGISAATIRGSLGKPNIRKAGLRRPSA